MDFYPLGFYSSPSMIKEYTMIRSLRITFALIFLLLASFSQADLSPAQVKTQQSFLLQANSEAKDILYFWFEEWDDDMTSKGTGKYNDKWFPHGPTGIEGSKETDRIIRERFMNTFEKAINNQLEWDIENNPYESLAYILLLDQFTRNMFRGSEKSYQYDHLSRAAVKRNIEQDFSDYYFTGYQKLFVVYPLMHHENLASQALSLDYLKDINEHSEHRYAFLNALQKGIEHYQIILMFNRFPHRNSRLDRKDTELEAAYLAKQGSKGFVDGSKW